MMDGFVKLYGTILTSSIWLEDDATLRVWITMLATADWNGYVGASVGGLAHVARVTREACLKALATFEAPDPDSRTPDDDGRRIKKVDGGWIVLNIKKYRDMRSDQQVKEAERKANWRAGKKQTGQGGTVPDVPVTSEQMLDGDVDKASLTPAREGHVPESPAQATIHRFIEAHAHDATEWTHLIDGYLGGLGTENMKAATVEQVAQAILEAGALGGDLTPRRFRRILGQVMEGKQPPPQKQNEGKTLRAGEIIDLIQQYKPPPPPPRPEPKLKPSGPHGRMQPVEEDAPPPLPTSPAWRDKLSQAEVRAVNAIGVQRIVTTPDDKRGILLAQLAKALAEAQA